MVSARASFAVRVACGWQIETSSFIPVPFLTSFPPFRGRGCLPCCASGSTLGIYRDGGAVKFSGHPDSVGVAPHIAEFDTIRTGLTVGMVIHPVPPAATTTSATEPCLLTKQGTFALCRNAKTNRLAWSVELGHRGTPTARNTSCVGTRPILDGSTAIVKATYNATSGCLKMFVNNSLDAACCPSSAPGAAPPGGEKAAVLSRKRSMMVAAAETPLVLGAGFSGAIEEIFLKNVSTENRVAYMYADDNRILGTHLIGENRACMFNRKNLLVNLNRHTHAHPPTHHSCITHPPTPMHASRTHTHTHTLTLTHTHTHSHKPRHPHAPPPPLQPPPPPPPPPTTATATPVDLSRQHA